MFAELAPIAHRLKEIVSEQGLNSREFHGIHLSPLALAMSGKRAEVLKRSKEELRLTVVEETAVSLGGQR